MQTSHFQLGLFATLAIGLGFSLASSEAIGYPAGAAVSLGANPIVSVGGTIGPGDTVTALTVPADALLIITDVYFGATAYTGGTSDCRTHFSIQDGGGFVLAAFAVGGNQGSGDHFSTEASLESGIPIESGDLTIVGTGFGGRPCSDSTYTLSGYYAQP